MPRSLRTGLITAATLNLNRNAACRQPAGHCGAGIQISNLDSCCAIGQMPHLASLRQKLSAPPTWHRFLLVCMYSYSQSDTDIVLLGVALPSADLLTLLQTNHCSSARSISLSLLASCENKRPAALRSFEVYRQGCHTTLLCFFPGEILVDLLRFQSAVEV